MVRTAAYLAIPLFLSLNINKNPLMIKSMIFPTWDPNISPRFSYLHREGVNANEDEGSDVFNE